MLIGCSWVITAYILNEFECKGVYDSISNKGGIFSEADLFSLELYLFFIARNKNDRTQKKKTQYILCKKLYNHGDIILISIEAFLPQRTRWFYYKTLL